MLFTSNTILSNYPKRNKNVFKRELSSRQENSAIQKQVLDDKTVFNNNRVKSGKQVSTITNYKLEKKQVKYEPITNRENEF